MHDVAQDQDRLAVLAQLRQAAASAYGEARAADPDVRAALELAATAVWRVTREPLDPSGPEPLPHV